jgi:hypothetical protein
VRLFDEVQARTRGAGREYQTAIADVLNVISRSPNQLQPVFDTIVQTAHRLCDAEFAVIYKLQDDRCHLVAASNAEAAVVKYASEHPTSPGRGTLVGRTALNARPCIPDYGPRVHIPRSAGHRPVSLDARRAAACDGVAIGVIALVRTVVKPFTDKRSSWSPPSPTRR